MTSKAFFKSLNLLYRFLLRRLLRTSYASSSCGKAQRYPPPPKKLSSSSSSSSSSSTQTIVCDLEGGLLRTSSTFPYFMLVALEAGGVLRCLLLLILSSLVSCMGQEVGLRVMVMVCFFGLRKESFRMGRAVLPKFLLEDVGLEGFEVVMRRRRRVCVISSMPTVMVESFAKEYLDVEVVVGRELKVFGGYYTGLMEEESSSSAALGVLLGKESWVSEDGVIGFGGHDSSLHHLLFSHCEEVYLVSEAEKRRWHPLPRCKYPKPLVFHDGRIAFRPTPTSTLCMFLWLPFGVTVAFARAFVLLFLPYSLSVPLLAFLGMHNRVINFSSSSSAPHREVSSSSSQLYISNHRTLLDPLWVAAVLGRRSNRVAAATYSVSRFNEWISPIRTIRMTRNREEDRRRMKKLLEEGDLVVCPEGTTCREPYLLRFSPLFAEVSRAVVPVALETAVGMFYGTSTSKLKFLDPLYFLMNPWPCYEVEFMGRVAMGTIGGGGRECSSYEMANYLQGEIGKLLGFECTRLTRKDKYLMLAGNEGIVGRENSKGRRS